MSQLASSMPSKQLCWVSHWKAHILQCPSQRKCVSWSHSWGACAMSPVSNMFTMAQMRKKMIPAIFVRRWGSFCLVWWWVAKIHGHVTMSPWWLVFHQFGMMLFNIAAVWRKTLLSRDKSCCFGTTNWVSLLQIRPGNWVSYTDEAPIVSCEATAEALAWYYGHEPAGNHLQLHGDTVRFLPQLLQPMAYGLVQPWSFVLTQGREKMHPHIYYGVFQNSATTSLLNLGEPFSPSIVFTDHKCATQSVILF